MVKDTIARRQGYGFTGPVQSLVPLPIISGRDPTGGDKFPIGQFWINQTTSDVYTLTNIAAGVATWVMIANSFSDLDRLTSNVGGVAAPDVAHNINLLGSQGAITTTSAVSTITMSFPTLALGTSGARQFTYNADARMLAVYAGTTGLAVGTSVQAFRTDLLQTTGNGTESPIASRGSFNAGAAADLEEGYGGFFTATQTDGSAINSNMIGILGLTTINEVNPADQPQQWIAGTQSIVWFDAAAGVPTAAIVCANLNHVMYDAAMNNIAHGVVVSRNGGGAGGTAGAAYKVVIGGGIVDWNYGIDLLNGGIAALGLYGLADIRLANGTTIDSLTVTDTYVTLPANGRISFQLGDAAGAEAFEWYATGPALVASVNSFGQLDLVNCTAGASGSYETRFSADTNLIQAYGNDTTAAGPASLNCVYGRIRATSGNGGHTPNGVQGDCITLAGSNVLQPIGVYGYVEQADGSIIASTAAGVEGHLDIRELNSVDQPQFFAFGVKGYLDSVDGAGATPATCRMAGVGSIVEYNTPFNGAVYGVNVSRLDQGVGAGTAGLAAYGVTQGIRGAGPIADWLYGMDLYNGATGVAYTTADIRLQNQSKIIVAAEGMTYTGNIAARSLNATNSDIPSFNVNPILQSAVNTGAAPTGATGDINIMCLQNNVTMQEFIIGAGQTIIAPRLEADGLLISLDLTVAEGAEYNFGTLARSKHVFTIGTSAAFFFEVSFKVADVSGCEPLLMGFRKVEANNATYTAYTDYATIGIKTSAFADVITTSTEIGGAGTIDTNTTNAFTDAQTHILRVNVTSAGVVTYLIDGAAPAAFVAYTFTNALAVMPFITLTHAAVAPGAIHIQSLKCGYQAWV